MYDHLVTLSAKDARELVDHIPEQYDTLWQALDDAQGTATVREEMIVIRIQVYPDQEGT